MAVWVVRELIHLKSDFPSAMLGGVWLNQEFKHGT